MRLDQELMRRGLCESRTEAQEMISQGAVLVNEAICTKQTKQVTEADSVEVTSRRVFVSRGGEKLQGVLLNVAHANIKQFSISNFQFSMKTQDMKQILDIEVETIRKLIKGKIALDIGSSTGGFTDCLLSYGVAHVDAVDVGTSQLHAKVRGDNRVSVFENTDIRGFKSDKKYDIIVADLSFISLGSVFDDVIKFGTNGTKYFLLIKPQFEVGKGNTKKGIVKDEALTDEVLARYTKLAQEKKMKDVQIFPCSITGGDGNQEYFLYGENKV